MSEEVMTESGNIELKTAIKEERLLFAIPKKGRLYQKILKVLDGVGLQHHRAARLDIARCASVPVTLVFLPAKDIADYVAEGNVDMGITGQDIIAEAGVDVDVLMNLGFGKCKLCVQGPIGKYKDAKELTGKRIVTSFPHLAKKYFDSFEEAKATETPIHYVSGSVEAACGLGLADGIVDLVETGTTMRAAGLEIVSTIMETETVLIAKPNIQCKKINAIVKKLHARIEGYMIATKYTMCSYNIKKDKLAEATKITPGMQGPTIQHLADENWVSVSSLVKASEASDIMDKLGDIGAKSILILALANCRFPK